MAYQPGDVVKFTVRQTYAAQECLNVFYYQMNDPFTSSLTPAQFGEIFWGWVQEGWRDLVSVLVTFDKVIIENLDGDLSYGEYVIPEDEREGTVAGEAMSPFEAFAIQLNRTNRLVRQGAKRLVGVVEPATTQFGELTVGFYDQLQLVADSFAVDLVVGLVTFANPVIVSFPNDNRPVRVAVPIDTATAKTHTTTQNTRKIGSGS